MSERANKQISERAGKASSVEEANAGATLTHTDATHQNERMNEKITELRAEAFLLAVVVVQGKLIASLSTQSRPMESRPEMLAMGRGHYGGHGFIGLWHSRLYRKNVLHLI